MLIMYVSVVSVYIICAPGYHAGFNRAYAPRPQHLVSTGTTSILLSPTSHTTTCLLIHRRLIAGKAALLFSFSDKKRLNKLLITGSINPATKLYEVVSKTASKAARNDGQPCTTPHTYHHRKQN